MKVNFTETVLRDANQSLIATRMPFSDFKPVLEKLDKVLDEALPEAFAIVKDSARRFAENEEVVVTATDADRNFAAKFDFVQRKYIILKHF